MVPKVTKGKTHDKGATIAKERVAVIGESRSDSTMAHEAGQFLGSLSEGGKYSSEYGHPKSNKDMLMNEYHTGKKIPYSAVPNFNYGYQSRKKNRPTLRPLSGCICQEIKASPLGLPRPSFLALTAEQAHGSAATGRLERPAATCQPMPVRAIE